MELNDMSKIVIIVFDCWSAGSGDHANDPFLYDKQVDCGEEEMYLFDYLKEHHIPYYIQNLTHSDLILKEEPKLWKRGFVELGG